MLLCHSLSITTNRQSALPAAGGDIGHDPPRLRKRAEQLSAGLQDASPRAEVDRLLAADGPRITGFNQGSRLNLDLLHIVFDPRVGPTPMGREDRRCPGHPCYG
jgi:hypothetical protein